MNEYVPHKQTYKADSSLKASSMVKSIFRLSVSA